MTRLYISFQGTGRKPVFLSGWDPVLVAVDGAELLK